MDEFVNLHTHCTDFKGTLLASKHSMGIQQWNIHLYKYSKDFFEGIKDLGGRGAYREHTGEIDFSNVAPIRRSIFFEDQIANKGCNNNNKNCHLGKDEQEYLKIILSNLRNRYEMD